MNGRVNPHNIRQYAPQNNSSNFLFDICISGKTVSAWIGMCEKGHLVGPFFYETNSTGDSYMNLITERIIPELQQIHGNRFDRLWWIIIDLVLCGNAQGHFQ